MKNKVFITITLLCLGVTSIAQVVIGTDNPDTDTPNAAAILEIKSTDKGILLPRLESSKISTLSNVQGLMVYCTDCNDSKGILKINNGSEWVDFVPASGGTFSGNVGIGAESTTSVLNSNSSGMILQSGGFIDTFRKTGTYAGHLRFYNSTGLVGIIATENQSLILGIPTKERMRISNNGNINFYEDYADNTVTPPASLVWDSSNTQLKITGRKTNRSGNTYAFDIDNSIQLSNLTDAGAMRVKGYFGDSFIINGLGDVSFFNDSKTAKFFWDASTERLGIGTDEPKEALDVNGNMIIRSNKLVINKEGKDTQIYLGGETGTNKMFLARSGVDGLLYNVDNGDLTFGTNNTERMRIDSNGNVGIGTDDDDPQALLHLKKNVGETIAKAEVLANSIVGFAIKKNSDDTDQEWLIADGATKNGVLEIYDKTDNRSVMSFDSDGNVMMGTTNSTPARSNVEGMSFTSGRLEVSQIEGPSGDFNRGNQDGEIILFRRSGNQVGDITVTTNKTSYNTSSDYRLKEDWRPIENASDRLMQLNPVNFAWKSNGSRIDGFLAHQVDEVVPNAVTGKKDGVDKDGNPKYQRLDHSKLVPILTAALQDALERIKALEQQLKN